ncbi:MAG: tetratricopeptide repeat protein [Chitinophagaceae bacterium]
MKKFFLILFISSLFLNNNATACLNEYYRSDPPFADGQLDLKKLLYKTEEALPYWYHAGPSADISFPRLDSLKAILAKRPKDFRLQSDIAVLQLKSGNNTEAIKLMEQLYAEHPDEYNIIINLGTAYEVTGNNAKALELIKKAVAINPNSHYGSEWIHINILEQKNTATPDYSRIIGLGIKNFPEWLTNREYKFPRPADSLKLQIAYQLHERIAFVAPPDDIVGRLVIDFADIVAKTDSYNEAIPFYEYGANYSASLSTLAAERKQGLQGAQKDASGTLRGAALIWGLPLLFIAFIVIAWIRNRKRKA